jgi:hypothetical protein
VPPGCAPGRWTGRAALFGHTPAQAALPSGARQGAWACGQSRPGALNTTPSEQAPAPGRAAPAAWVVPGAPRWRAPRRVPSGTPAPGACRHTVRRRTRPALSVPRGSPAQSSRGVHSFFASAFAAASGAGLASCGFGSTLAWGSPRGCQRTRATRSGTTRGGKEKGGKGAAKSPAPSEPPPLGTPRRSHGTQRRCPEKAREGVKELVGLPTSRACLAPAQGLARRAGC